MKNRLDRQYLKYSFYASLTLFSAIVFYRILGDLPAFWGTVRSLFGWLRWLISPFILAAFIAYFLNPGVRWFEEHLFSRWEVFSRRTRMRRNLSVLLVYAILFGFLGTLVVYVAPQVSANVREIVRRGPEYIRLSQDLLRDIAENLEQHNMHEVVVTVERGILDFGTRIDGIIQENLEQFVERAIQLTAGLINLILGVIVSMYLLSDKDYFKRGARRFLCGTFSPRNARRIERFLKESDELFSRYLVGKSLDSFIIGVLCFIGMWILGIRYALLLSVIVAVTNMIPYFGPFIGMIPAGLLTFFDSPLRALWVVLLIFGLQQFDAFYLGPKILGKSVGLPPFWIIFSIIVGGKLAGVLGMLLAVPFFGVLWLLLARLFDWLVTVQEDREKSCSLPEGGKGPPGT